MLGVRVLGVQMVLEHGYCLHLVLSVALSSLACCHTIGSL